MITNLYVLIVLYTHIMNENWHLEKIFLKSHAWLVPFRFWASCWLCGPIRSHLFKWGSPF